MTIAKTIVEHMSDRDIMLFLGSVRGWRKDAESFRLAASRMFGLEAYRVLAERLNDMLEEINGTEEEITDIYHALDITVNDLEHYPVLFRGKVKPFKWINISNIQCDHIPLNPEGLATAQLVRGGVPIPPISVAKMDNGNYRVQDGRHRFLAFKLNGLEMIPAYINPGKPKE